MAYIDRTKWRRETKCLNDVKLCKSFLSNAIFIMTYVNDVVKIVANLNSNVSTNILTSDLTRHINPLNNRHDS